ncbi:MAG: hypothetical protein N3I86_08140 [Verrucomicrobiae bacterium]|nr:hypothetical protein [Verrucomicrobiae bacterium]MDW8308044.1 hypothetical protein [Verrucomicrobiales bacterium]
MPLTRVTNPPAAGPHPATVATNDIRDIRPPVPFPNLGLWFAALLAALLVAFAALVLYHRWRARRNVSIAAPPEPPHVRARRRLQDALALLHDPRAFCFAVSDALRWYLEERFAFHAPERTTEEFLVELQHTGLLAPDQKTTLADFLQRCDLVKFARYQPGEPELRDLHAAALRLVEETEPVEPVASPGASPQSESAAASPSAAAVSADRAG